MHSKLSFYSFFTRYSLMEDYGFSSGLSKRLFRKVLPDIPDENTVEYSLLKSNNSFAHILQSLDFRTIEDSQISQELDLSIKALGSKIVAFGLDNNIKSKFNLLQLNHHSFENLNEKLNGTNQHSKESINHLILALESSKSQITLLRKNKHKIGTNFHLTITTRRILEYINQLTELLVLKLNIQSKQHWETMFQKFIAYSKNKNSLRQFVLRHSDLVALEIVEHTSKKGGKYIAESKKEYWNFFFKSLLGGGIISIFALAKIWFGQYSLSNSQSALIFSLNYAACFIFVKQFGGIIATKQPAVTASTIAKGIDSNDNLKVDSIQTVTNLIRKVARSQFISIIGNFIMAILFACLISFVLQLMGYNNIINTINPEYLIKNTTPTFSLIFFAAVAGVFLALSGLISGYVDNKLVASKIPYRISNSHLFFKSKRIAKFIELKSGALIGNICLGFLLGSAFLLSNLLPFAIDIRHIAFSSANIGFSIMNADYGINIIGFAMLGAILIGSINFLVSFSITLILALKSRGENLKLLPKVLYNVLKDFIRRPIGYFFFTNEINK